MKKTNLFLIVLGILLIVGGLYGWGKYRQTKGLSSNTTSPQIIGGEKDAHGCLGAAGYLWCENKKSCIRPWEEYCTATPPKSVLFVCRDSKTIKATFYPKDDKYVDLSLGDDRKLSIPRAISASGARYAKPDESFVFWNKGDTAFVTENDLTTFSDCAIKNQ